MGYLSAPDVRLILYHLKKLRHVNKFKNVIQN